MKDMKQTTRTKKQTGRVNTLKILEPIIEQADFGRKKRTHVYI